MEAVLEITHYEVVPIRVKSNLSVLIIVIKKIVPFSGPRHSVIQLEVKTAWSEVEAALVSDLY